MHPVPAEAEAAAVPPAVTARVLPCLLVLQFSRLLSLALAGGVEARLDGRDGTVGVARLRLKLKLETGGGQGEIRRMDKAEGGMWKQTNPTIMCSSGAYKKYYALVLPIARELMRTISCGSPCTT